MLRHNRLLNPIDILLFTVDKQNAVVCVPQTTAFNKKQNANKVLNPIGVLLFGIDKQCVVTLLVAAILVSPPSHTVDRRIDATSKIANTVDTSINATS